MSLRAFLKRGLDADTPGAIANSRLPKANFKDWGPIEDFKGSSPKCALFAAAIVGRGLIPSEQRSDFSALAGGSSRSELSCARQPENSYDANALLFCTEGGQRLGFATRQLAACLSPLLDAGLVKCGALLRGQHAALAAADPSSDVVIDIIVHFHDVSTLAAVHGKSGLLPPHLQAVVQRLREAWAGDGRPCLPVRGPAGTASSAGSSAKRARTMAAALQAAAGAAPPSEGRIANAQLLLTQPMPSAILADQPQPMISDLAAALPQSILVRLFSCPGLSVRDLVLSVRPVCRKWRDVVDSQQCTPARKMFEFARRTFPPTAPPPSAGVLAPASAQLGGQAASAEDMVAQPPSLPTWAAAAAPVNMDQLVICLRKLVPFHLGTMRLIARWALWGGEPPIPGARFGDARWPLDALLQRMATLQLPSSACASEGCRSASPPAGSAASPADQDKPASSCAHKLHMQDGWVFISLCLMMLPDWYVEQLLIVLLNTPRLLEQAVSSTFHGSIMLKHEVLNATYLLILLLSTPAWVQSSPVSSIGVSVDVGGASLASALANLQQLANRPIALSSQALVHDIVCGSYGKLRSEPGQQPAIDIPWNAVPRAMLLGVTKPMNGWALERKFSRTLVNTAFGAATRPQPTALLEISALDDCISSAASSSTSPKGSEGESVTTEPATIWQSTQSKVGLSTSLSLADGRVHTLLGCIRSIENPLGGFARTGANRGWTVSQAHRAGSGADTAPTQSRQLTEEQQSIVHTNVGAGELLRVMAFAGSGKTTTLVEYARARPYIRMLYLVFNVSIREAAEGIFPPNVHVMSVHKMAYAAIGRRYPRIVSDISFSVAREALGLPGNAFELATWVKDTIKAYCQGADKVLDIKHLPLAAASRLPKGFDTKAALASTPEHSVDARTEKPRVQYKAEHVLGLAQRLWNAMVSHADKAVPMTHEGYLKLYQMSAPKLSKEYGIILLDEAQDCAPVVAETVLSQGCGLVLVGDPHQSVYSFAGAVDTLSTSFSSGTAQLGPEKRNVLVRRLTRSFRYGPEIARVAGSILRTRKAETEPLIGLPRSKRNDRVRWESPSPTIVHAVTQHASLPSSSTDFQSTTAISPLDSPLQPDVLLARRRGLLRRVLHSHDFTTIDIGDVQRPLVALDTGAHERNSVAWSVAILARLNVTLLCLAFELSQLVVDATAEPMLPYDAHALEAQYLRAAKAREASVNVPLRARPDSVLRIAVIGATHRNPKETAFNMGMLEDICCLSLGAHGLVRDNLIKCFKSIQALDTFAERTNRSDLGSQIKFINSHGPGAVLAIIWRVRCCLVSDAAAADVVMGTVHKSKGLEFDEVILADDFISTAGTPLASQESLHELRSGTVALSEWHEEQNILYVAATRAKWQLWANEALCSLSRGANSTNTVTLQPASIGCEWMPSAALQNSLLTCEGGTSAAVWTSAGCSTLLKDACVRLQHCDQLQSPATAAFAPKAEATGKGFTVVPMLSPLQVVCRGPTLMQATCAAGYVLQALLREEGLGVVASSEPALPAAVPDTDLLEDQRVRQLGVHMPPQRALVRRRRQPAHAAAPPPLHAMQPQPRRGVVRRPRQPEQAQPEQAAASPARAVPASQVQQVAMSILFGCDEVSSSSPPRGLVRRRQSASTRQHTGAAVAATSASVSVAEGDPEPTSGAGSPPDSEGGSEVIIIDSD